MQKEMEALVESTAKWLFENKHRIRNPQFYPGWYDETKASPYCKEYMTDLAKDYLLSQPGIHIEVVVADEPEVTRLYPAAELLKGE